MKRSVKRAGRHLATLGVFVGAVQTGADYALYVADTPNLVLVLPGWLCPIASALFLMWGIGRVVEDATATLCPSSVEDDADGKAAQP